MLDFTPEERQRIASSILEKYEKVAAGPKGHFRYPTGQKGLDELGYDSALTALFPVEVREHFAGVGALFSMGAPARGERTLDVGCGAGVDTLIAAHSVGPEGQAVGLEFSAQMLARARRNRELAEAGNACFARGTAETLPFADQSFDLVVSNGVLNLVVDKHKALAEALRVLKRGGRLQVADQVLTGPPPLSRADMLSSWFT